jgi:hypothetical protein
MQKESPGMLGFMYKGNGEGGILRYLETPTAYILTTLHKQI